MKIENSEVCLKPFYPLSSFSSLLVGVYGLMHFQHVCLFVVKTFLHINLMKKILFMSKHKVTCGSIVNTK